MKILLLGASGRTGKQLLKLAEQRGIQLNCLVRASEKLGEVAGNIQLFQGSPIDSVALEEAMLDCDSIINVLNISRTSDFPWANLRTPTHFLSDVMTSLLSLAEKQKIGRIVSCSAWGVGDSRSELPFWFRWCIDYSNIGVAYSDHERQEKLLKTSSLDWTIVRPTGLINSQKTQQIIESYGNTPKPNLLISRKSLATYLLDAVQKEELIGKTPVISAV